MPPHADNTHGLRRAARRAAVVAAGGLLICAGSVMLFLPAPGAATLLAGLALLATEYAWARRWLSRGRALSQAALLQLRRLGPGRGAGSGSSGSASGSSAAAGTAAAAAASAPPAGPDGAAPRLRAA